MIDGKVVVTGSANWSGNGMWRNDENVVIIESGEVAGEGDIAMVCNYRLHGEDVFLPRPIRIEWEFGDMTAHWMPDILSTGKTIGE